MHLIVSIKNSDGTIALKKPAVINLDGTFSYQPVATDVAATGKFQQEWEVVYPDTKILTFPNGGYNIVKILPIWDDLHSAKRALKVFPCTSRNICRPVAFPCISAKVPTATGLVLNLIDAGDLSALWIRGPASSRSCIRVMRSADRVFGIPRIIVVESRAPILSVKSARSAWFLGQRRA
jgi:hypothetical protein